MQTSGEMLLLNTIWVLQSQLTNDSYHQPKLMSKKQDGAKVINKYSTATTPVTVPSLTTESARRTGRLDVRQ